jgi:hypothetical protein
MNSSVVLMHGAVVAWQWMAIPPFGWQNRLGG